MSIGIGQAMISLKKSSPSRIVLSQSTGSFGRFGSHHRSVPLAIGPVTFCVLCSVSYDSCTDALNSLDIWFRSRVRTPHCPPLSLDWIPRSLMNSASDRPSTSVRDCVRTASLHTQASNRRGNVP